MICVVWMPLTFRAMLLGSNSIELIAERKQQQQFLQQYDSLHYSCMLQAAVVITRNTKRPDTKQEESKRGPLKKAERAKQRCAEAKCEWQNFCRGHVSYRTAKLFFRTRSTVSGSPNHTLLRGTYQQTRPQTRNSAMPQQLICFFVASSMGI